MAAMVQAKAAVEGLAEGSRVVRGKISVPRFAAMAFSALPTSSAKSRHPRQSGARSQWTVTRLPHAMRRQSGLQKDVRHWVSTFLHRSGCLRSMSSETPHWPTRPT